MFDFGTINTNIAYFPLIPFVCQDIDAFSDDAFDAVGWINVSFRDYDQRQPKEVDIYISCVYI